MRRAPAVPAARAGSLPALLGRVAEASARHRVRVLVVAALAVGLLAAGTVRLRFADDPYDAMPPGDPHTRALERLVAEFPGSSYATPVMVSVAPEKWDAADARLPHRVRDAGPPPDGPVPPLPLPTVPPAPGDAPRPAATVPGPANITDEVYVRGMEELHAFLAARVPGLRWGITLGAGVKMVNYTNTGVPGVQAPDPAAFALPGTDPVGEAQYAQAWQTYFTSLPDAVATIVSADWSTTRLVFLFQPGDRPWHEVGQEVYAAVDAYRAEVEACDQARDPGDCSLQWNVFRADEVTVDPRGATAASAHLTRTTTEDLLLLGPLAALVVGAALLLAFRRVGTVLAMVLPLAAAGAGVVGVFGLVGVPVQAASLLVFPLLIGTGIDFGIHMAAAYHAARARGHDAIAAARAAGASAGPPLAVATLTTVAGMALLVAAPNRMLRELGLAMCLGMTLLWAVSLTCLPASLTWTRTPPPGRAPLGRWLARSAAFWGRHRAAAVALAALAAVGGALAAPALDTLTLGTPAAFFPPGDRQREEFDGTNARYFRDQEDLVTNLLVVEGPVATPATMALLDDLQDTLRGLPFVRQESVSSIRFAMEAWIQVREGTAGAPAAIAREAAVPGSTFPDDEPGIRALLDEMMASPIATYAAFFVDPDYRLATVVVEWRQPPGFADLDAQWRTLRAAVDAVVARHPGAQVDVHPVGQTALSYLFVEREVPYVWAAAALGTLVTGLLVLVLLRSPRDALVVSAVVLAAESAWLGLLVLLDIPLSVALVVPLLLITAVGSDYALHLRVALRAEGPRAWPGVGRAVVYSALTDAAAFLVFVGMRYGVFREAAVATAAGLLIALALTLLLVPALSPPGEGAAPPGAGASGRLAGDHKV